MPPPSYAAALPSPPPLIVWARVAEKSAAWDRRGMAQGHTKAAWGHQGGAHNSSLGSLGLGHTKNSLGSSGPGTQKAAWDCQGGAHKKQLGIVWPGTAQIDCDESVSMCTIKNENMCSKPMKSHPVNVACDITHP